MKKALKWMLSTIGVIVVGALGSGVWEYVFKPALGGVLRWLLDIGTLGMEKYKDQMYLEIARGFHERVSLEIYGFIEIFILGVALSMLFTLVILRNKRLSGMYDERFSSHFFGGGLIGRKWFIVFSVIYSLTLTPLVILKIAREQYINDSIAYYNQLKSIIAPFENSNILLSLDSRFSSIRNRTDYTNLIEGMKYVAVQNKVEPPVQGLVF